MKKIFLAVFLLFNCFCIQAQLIARIEMREPINGICNKDEVYVLFPSFKGQQEAVCSISKEEILKLVNKDVSFLAADKKYKKNCSINILINCKGEVLRINSNNSTKSAELPKHLEAVFKTLSDWKPGKLNGKEIDSEITYLFKIKKGQIIYS